MEVLPQGKSVRPIAKLAQSTAQQVTMYGRSARPCLLIQGSLFGMRLPYLVIVTWRPPFLQGGDCEKERRAGTENEKDRVNTRGLNSKEREI